MKSISFIFLTLFSLALITGCQKHSPESAAICPVCHMKMTVAGDTPRSVFKGKTFYFDEPEMKTMFDKNPMKYLNADLSINTLKAAEGH